MSAIAGESGGTESSNTNTAAVTDAPPAYSDPVEEVKHPDGPTSSYPGAPGAALAPGYAWPPFTSPQYIQQGQPIQYVVPAPFQTMSVTPKPAFPGPHSFIVLAIIVTAICGILNVVSLAFGIPALICAIICSFKVSEGQYPSATKYSMASFILTLLNIAFTMLIGAMITDLSIGYAVIETCRYLRRYSYGTNEGKLYCY